MPRLDASSVTLITPSNDGESLYIIDIARRHSIDVRISPQPWGATLDKEPTSTFRSLKHNVIIVEIPGPPKEAELRIYHELFVIDHHLYPALDRRNSRSSLEQFADLIGYNLNRREKGIALNDRGYIYAMREHGYTREEIIDIREFDLKAQGLTAHDFTVLKQDYSKGYLVGDKIFAVTTSNKKTSYLSDLHYFENETRGRKLDLLVLSLNEDRTVAKVSFAGTPASAKKLSASLGGFSGGDEIHGMYWGKEVEESKNQKEMIGDILKRLYN